MGAPPRPDIRCFVPESKGQEYSRLWGQRMNEMQPQYVGFWARVGAAIIDTILVLLVCAPLVTWIYGPDYWLGAGGWIAGPADFVINWLLPAVAVVLFWIYRQATPGKMAIGAKIVDAKTGGNASTGQLIGRYLA